MGLFIAYSMTFLISKVSFTSIHTAEWRISLLEYFDILLLKLCFKSWKLERQFGFDPWYLFDTWAPQLGVISE